MTRPLLVGTDGSEKMSKSLGNQTAWPSRPTRSTASDVDLDDTMWSYWTLLTDLRPLEIEASKGTWRPGRSTRKRSRCASGPPSADFHGGGGQNAERVCAPLRPAPRAR